MKAIIGKKVGMSQIFDENGHVIPVTVIEAGPCVVTQILGSSDLTLMLPEIYMSMYLVITP